MRKKTDARTTIGLHCSVPRRGTGQSGHDVRLWPSRGVDVARLRWRVVDIDKVIGCVSGWHCPRDVVDFPLLSFFLLFFSFLFFLFFFGIGDPISPSNSPHWHSFFSFFFLSGFLTLLNV